MPRRIGNRAFYEAEQVIVQRIAQRVRMRREMLGLTQAEVARSLGVAMQQFQKYEAGANGISAARLLRLAEILGVPVQFFAVSADTAQPGHDGGFRDDGVFVSPHLMAIAGLLSMVPPRVASQVEALLRVMAGKNADGCFDASAGPVGRDDLAPALSTVCVSQAGDRVAGGNAVWSPSDIQHAAN